MKTKIFGLKVALAAFVGAAIGFSPIAPALLVPFLLTRGPSPAVFKIEPMPPSTIMEFVDRGAKGHKLVPVYFGLSCNVLVRSCRIG